MPRFNPWLVVATLTAAGAAAAAGYGLTAPERYRATAELLVAPVSAADSTFAGLDVLRDASGRRTAAASAAVLLRSPQVADAVRAQLGLRQSSEALLGELNTQVAGASDVVNVSVEAASAQAAAQLANAFVDALIAQRTTSFQSELTSTIRRDAQLLATATGAQAAELARRLATLRGFQGQPDPTLRRGDAAVAPASAAWPDVPELVGIGAGAGLAAGLLLAFVPLAWRRRSRAELQQYDRPVSERPADGVAEALVDRLEQRLVARESALAARERDLQARIDELRRLEVGASASPPLPAADDARKRELDDREAALEQRERELGARLALVAQRETEVAHPVAGPAPSDESRERELARREAALAERVAVVERRELELARQAARQQAHAQPVRAPVAPVPVPDPADAAGAYNLRALEQLVEERAESFPERADEWRSYLYFLRDYAGEDGTLPGSFDWLVLDTFRELVA